MRIFAFDFHASCGVAQQKAFVWFLNNNRQFLKPRNRYSCLLTVCVFWPVP